MQGCDSVKGNSYNNIPGAYNTCHNKAALSAAITSLDILDFHLILYRYKILPLTECIYANRYRQGSPSHLLTSMVM